MKIAILTQPLTNNYGGIIQNFALQEVLRRKGHEVTTLNLRRPVAHVQFNLHFLLSMAKRTVLKYLLGNTEIVKINAAHQANFVNTPGPAQKAFYG
jgi:hypothetical protein